MIDLLDELGNSKQKNFTPQNVNFFLHFTTTDAVLFSENRKKLKKLWFHAIQTLRQFYVVKIKTKWYSYIFAKFDPVARWGKRTQIFDFIYKYVVTGGLFKTSEQCRKSHIT